MNGYKILPKGLLFRREIKGKIIGPLSSKWLLVVDWVERMGSVANTTPSKQFSNSFPAI